MPIRASACGNSVFEGELGLTEGDVALWLLWLSSSFSPSCCCDLFSSSLCLFTANLSNDSEANRRFWGKEKVSVSMFQQKLYSVYSVCVCIS